MSEIASRAQLRLSYFRWALFSVTLILALGMASGWLANSGYGNNWFAALRKPALMPPGWVFGAVWTVLYVMLGLAVAVVIDARRAPGRGLGLTLFVVQLLCNFSWSPLFFGAHETRLALYLLAVMILLTIAIIALFARVRAAAGLLLLPYLAWLCFAAYLTFEIDRLNPDARALASPTLNTQI